MREHDALDGVVRTPSISGWISTVRFRPSSPPTASSVKPKLELDACAEICRHDDEQRETSVPSGILVEIRPMAATERKSAISSCNAPAYWPCSVSM